MKKIKGKNGGTLYAREKGDPAPNKEKRKGDGKVRNKVQKNRMNDFKAI